MPTRTSAATPRTISSAALVSHASASADADVRVWGLTAAERLVRGLKRVGIASVAADANALPATAELVLLVRSDYFFDERLLQALAGAELGTRLVHDGQNLASVVTASNVASGAAVLRGETLASGGGRAATELVSSYDSKLRKHQAPFVLRARAENVRSVENEIFSASYKGITDLVTKWVWPLPAREVVRICARRGVSPNQVTYVSYVLALAVIALWAYGWFATGLVLGWLMTFLDTVDGKLARCTLTSSKLGDVLDHGLDLVHPPLWWAAWAVGLAGGPAEGVLNFGEFRVATWIILIGYLAGRLLEGVFMLRFRMDMFTWRPFDALFRQVIARRNPNLLLLTAGVIFAAPKAGFLAIAAWTLGSIAIQIVRIALAERERSAGRAIRSWYEAAEAVEKRAEAEVNAAT